MIWDIIISKYTKIGADRISRDTIERFYVNEYGYLPKTAKKWVNIFIESNNFDEKSGYILIK